MEYGLIQYLGSTLFMDNITRKESFLSFGCLDVSQHYSIKAPNMAAGIKTFSI